MNSRFEIGIYQDVVTIQLKTVLVVDHDLLHTQQTVDEDGVHLTYELFNLQTDRQTDIQTSVRTEANM